MIADSILVLEKTTGDYNLLLEQLSLFGYNEANFCHYISLDELPASPGGILSPTFIFANDDIANNLNAVQVYRHVQKIFPDVPVVILSNTNDDTIGLRCIKEGAQSFMVKGTYTPAQLSRVITFSTERNYFRKELERLKADYQSIFNQNPLPIFVVDAISNKIVAVNTAALVKYEYNNTEFTNLSLNDLSDTSKLPDNVCLAKPADATSYLCHYKKSGELIYVELVEGEINYNNTTSLLVTVNDITEKVLAAEQERLAKQRLDAIFKGTHDLIVLADDEGKIVQVNPAAYISLGYKESELINKEVKDIAVSITKIDKETELWDEFIETGTQTGIIELKKKTGETITCAYNASANILPGLHLSILKDISANEANRRKIEEQANRIEIILNSISECYYSIDRNWIIKYWNKAAEQTLGISKEEAIGSTLSATFNKIAHNKSYANYQKAMDEKVVVTFEDSYCTIDKWAEITAYPTEEGLTVYFKDITQKKKQSLQLLEVRNNQAALINASKDLIWSLNKDLQLVSFNKAYSDRIEKAVGITPEEGFQLPAIRHCQLNFDKWKKYYERGLAGESFTIEETILTYTDSHQKRAEITFTPICAIESEEVIGVACYSHDITNRVNAQLLIEEQNQALQLNKEALQKLTRHLEKIMDSSPDIICSVNDEGKFMQVSKASKYIWGYEPEELEGQPYINFIAKEEIPATLQTAKAVINGDVLTDFQNVYIHKDGSAVPMIWSVRWDKEERTLFAVGKNATALKEAERQKAESEQRFTAVVQKGADMIGIINPDGMYKYLSPNVINIIGYPAEELMKTNALSYIHPDDIEMAAGKLASVVGGGEVHLANFRFKHKNGQWLWLETVATNQVDNPAINGIVITSRDVSKRKENEIERELIIKELLKSNADLKQFSYITSHNLRAPLSNIIGVLNILDYDSLNQMNTNLISMLKTSAKQLNSTIDDLSQILMIKNNLNAEVSDINVEHAFNSVNKIFLNSQNDISARTITDFKVGSIQFNKAYFESILVNLLSNSIKYRSIDRQLVINVSTDQDDKGNAVLVFSDNGSGIDIQRHKGRLFGLYQRFHDNKDGQGLGLFIIKSQIVALGGKIEVDSEPGIGTTFTITFKKHYKRPEEVPVIKELEGAWLS